MRVWLVVVAVLAVAAGLVAVVGGGRADPQDYEAADRICEPALLEDRLDDANEAEVLQVAVQASAVPAGWTAGTLPGPRSAVRPVAEATVDLLDTVVSEGRPPPPVDRVDRRRARLARVCATYRR